MNTLQWYLMKCSDVVCKLMELLSFDRRAALINLLPPFICFKKHLVLLQKTFGFAVLNGQPVFKMWSK